MSTHELMPLHTLAQMMDTRLGLGLNQQTFQAIRVGDRAIRSHGKDPTHDRYHHFHVAAQFIRALNHNPSLRDRIDLNAFWRVAALHDIPVAFSDLTLGNLVLNQFFERQFAHIPAQRILKNLNIPQEELRQVVGIIAHHPLHPDSPRWRQWAETVDERTQMTANVFYYCDTGDIYRYTRIREMVTMVEHILGKRGTDLLSPWIHRYAITRADISIIIPGFPWFNEEFDRKKQAARTIVDRLFAERQKRR